MVIYLYGADTKRSREQLEKLVEKFYRERDVQKMNVLRVALDGDSEIVDGDVQAQALAAPFLAEKRLVIFERLLERGSNDLLAWFSMRCVEQAPPSDVIFILWEEEPLKRATKTVTALHEALAAGQYAQEFVVLDARRREQYIVKFLADQKVGITQDALASLARRVTDSYELATTLAVLAAFGSTKGGQPLTARDLDQFLAPDIENTIFKAMDELSAQQRALALAQLAHVWYADNDPVYVFAMLHRQVRLLLEVDEIMTRLSDTTEQALARELGVHPFVAKKLMLAARRWSREDLYVWYERLHQVDFAMKHSVVEPRILVNRFVAA